MLFKTRAYRSLNRVLETFNLEVIPISRDFDARPVGLGFERMIVDVTDVLHEWIDKQQMFVAEGSFSTEEVRTFYDAYLETPFRRVGGGSRFNNLLSLWAVARSYRPDVIFDSGTFTGASAWALAMACPEARVLSYDIDLTRLRMRTPGVTYVPHDWMEAPVDAREYPRSLAYFDDHVDQARRLIETHRRGVKLAVFDDDFSVTTFMPFAHGGAALPKVDFVLDASLRDRSELEWQEQGRRVVWPIDHGYLDQARATIAKADRLPDFGSYTGISQLPYRVVAMTAA